MDAQVALSTKSNEGYKLQFCPDSNRYYCEECGKEFTSRYSGKLHIESLHRKSRLHRCPKCSACFPSPKSRHRHFLLNHSESTRVFKCEFCEQSFSNNIYLNEHIHQKHKRERSLRDLSCPVCGEGGFKRDVFLQKHFLTSHNKLNNGSMCCIYENCNFKCKSYHSLRVHLRLHAAENCKFSCDRANCEATFLSYGDLVSHRKEKHQEEELRCQHCKRKFVKTGNFNLHVAHCQEISPKRTTYLCPVKGCHRILHLVFSLRDHIMTKHLRLKSYHCEKCLRDFQSKNSALFHARKFHSESNPYQVIKTRYKVAELQSEKSLWKICRAVQKNETDLFNSGDNLDLNDSSVITELIRLSKAKEWRKTKLQSSGETQTTSVEKNCTHECREQHSDVQPQCARADETHMIEAGNERKFSENGKCSGLNICSLKAQQKRFSPLYEDAVTIGMTDWGAKFIDRALHKKSQPFPVEYP